MYFQVCSNSTYPQHSGERYSINGPLVYIISSFGHPEELFLRPGNSSASVCPSYCPSVNISCYRISSKTPGRIILKLGQNVPLSVSGMRI